MSTLLVHAKREIILTSDPVISEKSYEEQGVTLYGKGNPHFVATGVNAYGLDVLVLWDFKPEYQNQSVLNWEEPTHILLSE